MKKIDFFLKKKIFFFLRKNFFLNQKIENFLSKNRKFLIKKSKTSIEKIKIRSKNPNRLIKMIVIPIVISSLIVGIAGVGDAKKLGRIGFKTIIYFEIVTTIAIVVGLLLANLFHPGAGIDMSTLGTVDISKYRATAAEVSMSTRSSKPSST